jgi:hypothetical protein
MITDFGIEGWCVDILENMEKMYNDQFWIHLHCL